MATEHYLEDFSVGQIFQSGTISVSADEIKAFASQFDPQPFHLDETAAKATFFGGLVASGWHTAALTMRLIVDSELKIAGGSIGAGAEELRWPRPVRPGDTLRTEHSAALNGPIRFTIHAGDRIVAAGRLTSAVE